jgi:hypothetical protein
VLRRINGANSAGSWRPLSSRCPYRSAAATVARAETRREFVVGITRLDAHRVVEHRQLDVLNVLLSHALLGDEEIDRVVHTVQMRAARVQFHVPAADEVAVEPRGIGTEDKGRWIEVPAKVAAAEAFNGTGHGQQAGGGRLPDAECLDGSHRRVEMVHRRTRCRRVPVERERR